MYVIDRFPRSVLRGAVGMDSVVIVVAIVIHDSSGSMGQRGTALQFQLKVIVDGYSRFYCKVAVPRLLPRLHVFSVTVSTSMCDM